MAGTHVLFRWQVSSAGYEWILGREASDPTQEPRPVLVARDPASPAALPPRPGPALFQAFAEIASNQEAILAFAGVHGNLHGGVEFVPEADLSGPGAAPVCGVPLDAWSYHITELRSLIALWDLLVKEDRGRLAKYVRWRKGGPEGTAVYFVPDPGTDESEGEVPIASGRDRPELLERFEPGDPVLPGWTYLQQALDGQLFQVGDDVLTGMTWDAARGRPSLALEAHTLVAAVWAQFSEAVGNDRRFSRCRECGTWFEIAPDAARSHRRFCSNSCRSKAYRERQDRARQLFTAGKAFAEIAEELDSDEATVRRWVTGVKE
jgi:hypothetical protein